MAKLQVGDRVQLIAKSDVFPMGYGALGTLVHLDERTHFLYVDWDDEFPGAHDCSGFSRDRHGWIVTESQIAVVDQEDISIDSSELPDFDLLF